MQRLFFGASAAALTLAFLSLARAEPPRAGDEGAGGGEGANCCGQESATAAVQRPTNHRHLKGHDVLPRGRLKTLPNGKHPFKAGSPHYRAHVLVKDGKVASMEVRDRQGRKVAVRKHRKGGGARVDLSSPDTSFVSAGGPGGGFVCFSFRISDSLSFSICWPLSSCHGDDDD